MEGRKEGRKKLTTYGGIKHFQGWVLLSWHIALTSFSTLLGVGHAEDSVGTWVLEAKPYLSCVCSVHS